MTDNNFEEKINDLKKLIDDAERKKIQLETRKEEALKRKDELDNKCKKLKVKPSNIDSHILKLEDSISKSLSKFDSLLSYDNKKETNKYKDDYDAIF